MTSELRETEVLRERLAAVERRTARLRRASGLGGLVLAIALALVGTAVYRQRRPAGTAEDLEARQFVLRDANGKVRAVLGARADDSVALVLKGADEIPRIMLAVGVGPDSVPTLALSDGRGRLRAAIAVAVDGAASVGFLDESQVVRTTLGTTGNGLPALNLVDDARRVRVALQADGDGTSLLRLFDGVGRPLISLGLRRDAPSLAMRDGDGTLLGSMPDR